MLDSDELESLEPVVISKASGIFLLIISLITSGGSGTIVFFALQSQFDRIRRGHLDRIIGSQLIESHDLLILIGSLFAGGVLLYFRKILGWMFLCVALIHIPVWMLFEFSKNGSPGRAANEILLPIIAFTAASAIFLNAKKIREYFGITRGYMIASFSGALALLIDTVFVMDHV